MYSICAANNYAMLTHRKTSSELDLIESSFKICINHHHSFNFYWSRFQQLDNTSLALYEYNVRIQTHLGITIATIAVNVK